MKNINKLWTLIEDILAGTFFFSGISIIFYGVVMRYVFNAPQSWTGEISVYVLIWAALLGISVALRNNQHIKVDLLYDRLSTKLKYFVDLFATIIGLLFCVFYIYFGAQLVIDRIPSGLVSLDVGIPMWIVYLILPISGVLFFIRFIERFVVLVARGEKL